MKKFLLMMLALLTVVGVSAFGFEKAGPLGSMAALGITTTVLAYFYNGYMMHGRLFATIGVMRPLARGESNLGGIVKLNVYTEAQFTSGANWPVRGKSKVTTAIPLKTSPAETAAVFTFDIGTCKGTWTGSGSITNQSYKHMLEFDVSGFTQEQLDTLDDLYNQGLVVLATYQNGDVVIYGSTRAPLAALASGDTGAKPEDDGKKTKVKFESIVACDFPPRKAGAGVTITEATVAAYPTQVNGVTP